MATKTLFDRAAKTITATGQMRYKNAYKRRLMDKCIMGDIIMGTAAPGMPDWPRSVAHHTTDPVYVK